MRGLMRDAARAVAEQRQIVIFPEGTRAEPGTLLPLQPGVAALAGATGLPVIPVLTELGALLEQAGVPQAPGRHPHRAAAADRRGDAAGRIAAAFGGGITNRRTNGEAACGQVCGLTLRSVPTSA